MPRAPSSAVLPRILIAGCGFGGITVADNLRRLLGRDVPITAIDANDRFDYHASLPALLSGRAKVDDITVPLAPALARKKVNFVQGRIMRIDWKKRHVHYTPTHRISSSKSNRVQSSPRLQSISYDYLVLALGSRTAFYNIPGAQKHTFEFKSYHDALSLSEHITSLFESCPRPDQNSIRPIRGSKSHPRPNPAPDDGRTRIVVIGGGLTGVELVADLQSLLDRLCKSCGLSREQSEIVLVHRSSHLRIGANDEVGDLCESYLQKLGIRLQMGSAVKSVEKDAVLLEDSTRIRSRTIVWCAGIQPSETIQVQGEGAYDERCGLVLNPLLRSIGDERVYAVGDCAYCSTSESHPVLSYLRAVEQADFVSHNLYCEIKGHPHARMPYMPRSFPTLISLGPGMGVLTFNGLWMAGRRWLYLKTLFEKVHLLRYRYGFDFLEFFDEFAVAALEILCFMRVRSKD